MIAKVISIASPKGGSGKTGLTATFGTFLSRLGKRVLIVDADFATNGLSLFYLKESKIKAELIQGLTRTPQGLFDSLNNKTSCDVVELNENLHLIPANYKLSAQTFRSKDSTFSEFSKLVFSLRPDYDFILIDAQAGTDEMSELAINRRISDEVVIVSEYDPMSAAGVERLKALFREDLTYDRTWVLLNKILPEFAQNFGDFLEVAKYLNPIPWDAEVVRAYARRKLAIDSDTGNEYTISIIQTLKSLFGELISEELNEWIKTRASVIRQPIIEQYSDAELEMEFLLRKRTNQARQNQIAIITATVITSVIPLIVLYLIDTERIILQIFDAKILVFIAIPIVLGLLVAYGKGIPFFRDIFNVDNVKFKVEEARFDRQLDLLQDKLKRLELLKSLEPEMLLQRADLLKESHTSFSRYK